MPHLSRIIIYPVKSLPGVMVDHAVIAPGGGLVHDREYALVDKDGWFINGKRNRAIHRLDASCAIVGIDPRVTIRTGGVIESFRLDGRREHHADIEDLERRLSLHFNEAVSLKRDIEVGFPDDLDFPGPTVISEATLTAVAGWYPGLTVHDMRLRFRANLEFSDCPAFWEDRLYGNAGDEVAFQIGDVGLFGTNPCRRCVVPTRDPATGEELAEFRPVFIQRRMQFLPPWANGARFENAYRLAVNTRADSQAAGHILRLGDEVRIL